MGGIKKERWWDGEERERVTPQGEMKSDKERLKEMKKFKDTKEDNIDAKKS